MKCRGVFCCATSKRGTMAVIYRAFWRLFAVFKRVRIVSLCIPKEEARFFFVVAYYTCIFWGLHAHIHT